MEQNSLGEESGLGWEVDALSALRIKCSIAWLKVVNKIVLQQS